MKNEQRCIVLYRCNDAVVSINGGGSARDCLCEGRNVSKADCINGCFLSLCKAIRSSKYRDLIDLHIFYDSLSFNTRISLQRLSRSHSIYPIWHHSDNSNGIHQSFVDQLVEAMQHVSHSILLIEDDYLVEEGAIDSLIDLKLSNPADEFAVNLLNEGVWDKDSRDTNLLQHTDADGVRYRTCCHSTCSFFLSHGRLADKVLNPSFDPKIKSPERATVNPRLFSLYGWAPTKHMFHHMQCNVLNYEEASRAKNRFSCLLEESLRIQFKYGASEANTRDRFIMVSLRGAFIRSWLRAYFATGNTIPLIICTGPQGDWSDDDYLYCLKAAAASGGFVHDCSQIWQKCKEKAQRGNRHRCGWYTKTALIESVSRSFRPKTFAWIDDDVEVIGNLSVVFDYAETCSGFILSEFYNKSEDGKHPKPKGDKKINWNSLTIFHGDANDRLAVLKNDFPVEDDEIIFGHLYATDPAWYDGFEEFPKKWQHITKTMRNRLPDSADTLIIHYTSHYADGCKDYWRDKASQFTVPSFETKNGCASIPGTAVLTCLTDGHIKPFLYWYLKSGSNIPLYIIRSNEWASDKAAIAEAAVRRFGGAVLDYDDVWDYIQAVAPEVSHPAWGAKVMWWRKFVMSGLCPERWMWLDSDVMVNQPIERTFEWFEHHPHKYMGAQSRLGHGAGLFKGRDWFNNYNVFRDRTRCLELFNKIIKSQFDRKFFDDENNLRHVLVTLKNDDLLAGVQDMSADISYDEPLFSGFYDHDHAKYAAVHFGGGRAHSEFKRRFADIDRKSHIDLLTLLSPRDIVVYAP